VISGPKFTGLVSFNARGIMVKMYVSETSDFEYFYPFQRNLPSNKLSKMGSNVACFWPIKFFGRPQVFEPNFQNSA